MQVGCDPKHDSTRQLLNGQSPPTVLEYLRKATPDQYAMEDIVSIGYNGVACVEAGGPEPGVGCAGRGILSTFNLLEDLGVRQLNYDLILYDVLGDVVCGGFAVPIRNDYADVVYIVTSGEFMSIYSANNILRGVTHFDNSKHRIGGLIFNERNIEGEYQRVKNFAEAVHLPILARIPRSNEFAEAERQGKTLIEHLPDSSITGQLKQLAASIAENPTLYTAQPLSESELEKVVLRTVVQQPVDFPKEKNKVEITPKTQASQVSSKLNRMVSKNVLYNEPLHGCAYCGAMAVCSQVKDAIVISHGPRSCAHMAYNAITSSGRRALNERAILYSNQVQPNIVSTDKDENIMVFGGLDLLRDKIAECKRQNPSAIFVVSACTSGIIGDELQVVRENGNIPVIPVETDGDIAGDYMQGAMMANEQIALNLVDTSVQPEDKTVNIIGEKSFYKNSENNFEAIERLLTGMGIEVNCRYLLDSPITDIKKLKRAALNIHAFTDFKGRMLSEFFERRFGMQFFDTPFPIGLYETTSFVQELGAHFHIDKKTIDNTLESELQVYNQRVESLKGKLKNKRIIIILYNRNIDWLLEVIQHLEMNLVKLYIMNSCQEDHFNSRYAGEIEVEMNFEMQGKEDEIRAMRPDILLSSYNASVFGDEFFTDSVPYSPDIGTLGAIEIAERWGTIFDVKLHEGWKADEQHFVNYFSGTPSNVQLSNIQGNDS
jgi:nitrogenase iron protein